MTLKNNRHIIIFDAVQILSTVISLTSGILGLVLYVNAGQKANIWIFCTVLACIVMLGFTFIRLWANTTKRFESTNQAFHNFNHTIRNELYKLKLLSASGTLTRESLVANVEKTGQFSVNLLSELLTEITQTPVSVHIKAFPVTSPAPLSYRTLCICSMADRARLQVTDHPIARNTHFRRIVEGHDNHFLSNNLAKRMKDYKKATGEDFLISTDNWKKWFLSILVVPIRIECRLRGIEDGARYDYLGFVCCDSPEKGAFKLAYKKALLDMAKSFADGLYVYLDEIRGYSSTLK